MGSLKAKSERTQSSVTTVIGLLITSWNHCQDNLNGGTSNLNHGIKIVLRNRRTDGNVIVPVLSETGSLMVGIWPGYCTGLLQGPYRDIHVRKTIPREYLENTQRIP
jgi:hypothetical protein